jgi:hypothetical protein
MAAAEAPIDHAQLLRDKLNKAPKGNVRLLLSSPGKVAGIKVRAGKILGSQRPREGRGTTHAAVVARGPNLRGGTAQTDGRAGSCVTCGSLG